MATKLTVSNNPHVYHRKKHFRRRQSHQPRMQKEEKQKMEMTQNPEEAEEEQEDFYYMYNQDLIKKEKTVQKAQLVLLKLASQENQDEEEQRTNWTSLMQIPKFKINFLKQLGYYMDESQMNKDKAFSEDEASQLQQPQQQNLLGENKIKQLHFSTQRRQIRGVSVDGTNFYRSQNEGNERITIHSLKQELLRMQDEEESSKMQDRFKLNSQEYFMKNTKEDRAYLQLLGIDPKHNSQQKKSLNQCNIASVYPYIIHSGQVLINSGQKQAPKSAKIPDQKDYNSSSGQVLVSTSRKRSSTILIENNARRSSSTLIENESQDNDGNKSIAIQEADETAFTPISYDRKKQNHQYSENFKKYINEREKMQSSVDSGSNSNIFNLTKVKQQQQQSIMKMKPFVISMLQTSTMLRNNHSDLKSVERSSVKEDDGEQFDDHGNMLQNNNKNNSQFFDYYLNTHQSDENQSSRSRCQHSSKTKNHNRTISNFKLSESEDNKNLIEKRKPYQFSSERKPKDERPKTSNFHQQEYLQEQETINRQNKEKILNIINSTNNYIPVVQNHNQNQTINGNSGNSGGGSININHSQFKLKDNQSLPIDNSKENNSNDSNFFLNKGILQYKNKFKILLNGPNSNNSNNINTINHHNNINKSGLTSLCNTTRSNEISSRFTDLVVNKNSFVQNTLPIKQSARISSGSEDRAGLKNLLKNNRAVTIGKARNSVISKNSVNNSNIFSNTSYNGNNNSFTNNTNNKTFVNSYYQNQSLYNQQLFFTDKSNLVGYQVISSDKQNLNVNNNNNNISYVK